MKKKDIYKYIALTCYLLLFVPNFLGEFLGELFNLNISEYIILMLGQVLIIISLVLNKDRLGTVGFALKSLYYLILIFIGFNDYQTYASYGLNAIGLIKTPLMMLVSNSLIVLATIRPTKAKILSIISMIIYILNLFGGFNANAIIAFFNRLSYRNIVIALGFIMYGLYLDSKFKNNIEKLENKGDAK